MTFGEKIKGIRLNMNLNQEQFGALIGVSRRSVIDYESGKSMPRTRDDFKRIAAECSVDVNYLLSEDEDFLLDAEEKFGTRGKKSAEKLMRDAGALFAGGELASEDMDALMIAFQKMYIDAKNKNREKYSSKKETKA